MDCLVDRLLADCDSASCESAAFWGAQYDAGLAWVDFPVGRGGLGLPAELQRVVDTRLQAAGAPVNKYLNFVGIGMAAPTLNAYADDDHCDRLLRPLFTCEDIWCQLFSEPGSGSDLASLATRAVRDGDEWVVNGQKVWTTLAHVARWGLLIARTDPDQPKHRGLTCFYVDMSAPGVEVRPLRQLTGAADFNEVYLDEVRVPDCQRLGGLGDGWRVALTTLMNERETVGGLGNEERGSGLIQQAVQLMRDSGRDDPVLRDRLAQLWIEAEVLRFTRMRANANRGNGTAGAERSILKLFVSHFQQRVSNFCVDVMGLKGTLVSGYEMTQPTTILETTSGIGDIDHVKGFLRARGLTIGGGTTEIARNIIGERVLDLPPEPRADKDSPWSQIPRS